MDTLSRVWDELDYRLDVCRDTRKAHIEHLVFQGCEKVTKYTCPILYCLIYSRENEYRILKAVAGFLYGCLLGIAFYELILVDLEFTEYTCLILGLSICFVLGLGNAVSIQIRCISLLTVPSFCGRAGRGVLKAVVLAYMLAGPLQNITYNGREVVRIFACSATLTYNLTKTRFDLMVRPFAEAILNLKADVNEVKDTMKSVKSVILPVAEEIEGEEEMRKIREDNEYIDQVQGDSSRGKELKEKFLEVDKEPEQSRYEKRYMRKMAEKCENVLSKGAGTCRRMFAEAYDKCYSKVSWVAAWLLCWPMKLTFVCNIVEAIGGNKPCEASKILEPGFGEGYSYLKHSQGSLSDEFKAARIQYQVPRVPKMLDVRQASDTAKAVVRDFQKKKMILDQLMTIIKRLFAFIFIRIIFGAQGYHDQYLSDIQFDNVYITHYFRRIDARRHRKDQHTLLPLKKLERAKFIDPYGGLPAKRERKNLVRQTVKLLLEMVTATTLIILDRLLYETLDMVRRHAHIDYMQEGAHDLILKVKGTGMIATLVRSVLGGFNIRKRVKTLRSNEACLPHPMLMPDYYFYKIYGTYLGIWLLLLTEAYTQRIRRAVCAYFYPKREKRRVLFLYNENLKRRRGLFKFMRAKVKRMVREHRLELKANILLVLRVRYPTYCRWVRFLAAARRKCLICEEPEPWKSRKTDDFVSCPNTKCHFVYCSECWKDIERTCYACSSPAHSETEDDEDYIFQ
ncbi:protein sneaky [Periplaneta americana]|uniref:protein sneaky n=1 Tax=Periplaneta americana TaxID=6978 RepID=UPI0037E714ED